MNITNRNKEKNYNIRCTPNEFYMLIYWAYEGVDSYNGADGWKTEDIEEAIDKISDQVKNQENT